MENCELSSFKKGSNDETFQSWLNAKNDLRENIELLFKERKIKGIKYSGHWFRPQTSGLMILGNTNPTEPWKGKWYFSLPYDYV